MAENEGLNEHNDKQPPRRRRRRPHTQAPRTHKTGRYRIVRGELPSPPLPKMEIMVASREDMEKEGLGDLLGVGGFGIGTG